MSLSSIPGQGYTPPDFLQKLFKRNSTVSSQPLYKPLSPISHYNPVHQLQSSPSLPSFLVGQNKYSPRKLARLHSLNQDQMLSTKKFKIFYNAVMQGVLNEMQCTQIWKQFEKSLNNPFEYDQLIQEIRRKKQHQKIQQQIKKQQSIIHQIVIKVQQNIKKSHSNQKLKTRQRYNTNKNRNCYSLCNKNNQNSSDKMLKEKQKMKKHMKYIRSIIKHGEKFIKNK